jgi:glycosyltransferase involved in cell wall biosynthesis
MPRALLVSWLFPPHRSIGAKRAYRFARHLPGQGWDVTVLCGRQPPPHYQDPSAWSVPDGVRVSADYDPAWLNTLANRLDDGKRSPAPEAQATAERPAPARAKPFFARATSALEEMAIDAVPTEPAAVHLPHAIRSALRLARQDRASAVWTTSYPYSSHLIGVALKRALRIPFVADLRDPWTLNFVHDQKLRPTRWVERRLEAVVFEHADRVTVTTDALADAYRERYPRHARKFVTIRNAFEPRELPPRDRLRGPTRLVHFGNVYAARSLCGVYEALARLRARGALRPGSVVLENYGRLSDEDRARVDALDLHDIVRVMEPVPYEQGLAILRSADLLLLPAQIVDGADALFLPGKLYDYLLAGAPVLGLGETSELARILAHTRTGTLHADDDVEGIAAALSATCSGTLAHEPDPGAVAEYGIPHATRKLAAIFDEISTPPPT